MSFNKEGSSQCLLPGIPNQVTLDVITPKLSWRDFYVLSSVSRAWLLVIRSRQVYNIRVHQQCTETLVLINYIHHTNGYCNTLYSIKDNWSCELPPVANVAGGFLEGSSSVSLDGNIYVMGGHPSTGDPASDIDQTTRSVHVLVLVGQRKWRRCADMIHSRTDFACGAMQGKIYVFGGNEDSAGEWYDPKEDKWSEIFPSTKSRSCHHVEIVGEEFFLNRGQNGGIDVYNPPKDEWRVIQTERSGCCMYFSANRQLHLMDPGVIHVYNSDANSWTRLHASSFSCLGPLRGSSVDRYAALQVNDEVLAVVSWGKVLKDENWKPRFNCLVQTKGLGNKTVKKVRWRKVLDLPLSGEQDHSIRDFFLYAVEL